MTINNWTTKLQKIDAQLSIAQVKRNKFISTIEHLIVKRDKENEKFKDIACLQSLFLSSREFYDAAANVPMD